jgi:hypothetical protein|nr:MAG: replication initiator protein [Microviridae sp.]
MNCVSPMSVPRPSGLGTFDRITIPCGKCMACLSKKRSQWAFRLSQELKSSRSAYFITMTYDEKHIPKNESLCKRDCQLFLKRLRQKVQISSKVYAEHTKAWQNQKEWPPIRYFLVGEYGSNTSRPHYHLILFNLPDYVNASDVIKTWGFGNIHIGDVNPKSINYTAKYCINEIVSSNDKENTFTIMSRRPGIGINYVERLGTYHRQNKIFYGLEDYGKKVSLPRFYRDKIFSRLNILINQKQTQKLNDEKVNELRKRLESNGEDIGQRELNQKSQYSESIKKSLKTSSKL